MEVVVDLVDVGMEVVGASIGNVTLAHEGEMAHHASFHRGAHTMDPHHHNHQRKT